MDLDGDGDLETLTFRVAGSDMDGDEHAEIAVEDGGETTGWNSEVLFYPSAYAADIDGDGIVEIFVCGDWASADYATYCLHWDGSTFTQLPFANASRSGDGGDYLYYGYGYVQAIEDGLLTLCGSQDVLGTYFGTRVFALQNGTFEFADDGLWRFPLDEYSWDRALVPTQDIAATFVEGGAETEGVIPAGDALRHHRLGQDQRGLVPDGGWPRRAISPSPPTRRAAGALPWAARPRTSCSKWCLTRIEKEI